MSMSAAVASNVTAIESARLIEVCNPYSKQVVGTVHKATVQEVRDAIATAKGYDFRLTAWQRFEILSRFAELLKRDTDEVVRLISLESGKTLKEPRTEVNRSYQTFLLSAEEAKRINGEALPIDAVPGMDKGFVVVVREPIGVVVAITPFNFPLNLVAHKVGPAIAANNPILVKPSSLTPLTALKMAELFAEAGLPDEMLHVITGDHNEIGDELIGHDDVAKVTFTGSAQVGKAIHARMGGLKSVCMELGGNDPLIILADAHLDKALPIAVDGAFGCSGQRCTSVKRIIIEDSIADEFIERFLDATKALRVGDPMDDSTDIGPVINDDATRKVEQSVDAAQSCGAKLLFGGERDGAVYWPAILDHVDAADPLVVDETFGPVAPFIRVSDLNQAIEITNSTAFGLQAGVFTRDLGKAMEASRRIDAGAVMINLSPGFRAEHLPFGGVKGSGIGREGVKYAVEAMTRTKMTVMGF